MKKVIRKICLLGDESVGKTSLVRRYVENSYSEVYKTTIGVSLSKKTILKGDIETILMIWDLEGNRNPNQFPSEYIEGSYAALTVVDICRPETFEKACLCSRSFLDMNRSGRCFLAINKIDRFSAEDLESRVTSFLEKDFSRGIFSKIQTVSAKTGSHVESLFLDVAGANDEP